MPNKAPLGPVADWLVYPDGTLRNLVGGATATITGGALPNVRPASAVTAGKRGVVGDLSVAVTIPTTGWNAAEGTFVAVAAKSTVASGMLMRWGDASGFNYYDLFSVGGTIFRMRSRSASGTIMYDTLSTAAGIAVYAGRYKSGDPLRAYVNGTAGVRADACTTPVGLPATAYIGTQEGTTTPWTDAFQRFIVYSRALTDDEVAQVTNAVKLGPRVSAARNLLLGVSG